MKPATFKHLLEQGPMLRALGATALGAVRRSSSSSTQPLAIPGPWIEDEARAPSADLVRAFVAFSRGDQASYRGVVPPHFFPQWTLASAARALAGSPYPLTKIVNAGVSLEVRDRIPAGVPLRVHARLESIDARPTRALLTTRIETGPVDAPDALVAELRTYVPLAARPGEPTDGRAPKPAPVRVPDGARELAHLRLPADAGLTFATLTGDLNPIHWIPAYARAAGFKTCILHGFGTFALATSAIVRGRLSGDAGRLRVVEARFTHPLALPGAVGIYVTDAGELFAGDGVGAVAYLAGRCLVGASR
jgi:acyl dehydratase